MDQLASSSKGYFGNWPHYYRVVHSKLMSCKVLTNSINNTHIKRKNSKTICSSETISSQIFGSGPNSPNTRCYLLVGLTCRSLTCKGSSFHSLVVAGKNDLLYDSVWHKKGTKLSWFLRLGQSVAIGYHKLCISSQVEIPGRILRHFKVWLICLGVNRWRHLWNHSDPAHSKKFCKIIPKMGRVHWVIYRGEIFPGT
jgi:hypothetical protein